MRGRKPKPTALKLAKAADTPQPECRVPECPDELQGEARREWDRVTALLAEVAIVTELDRAAIAVYCTAWARWLHAEQQIPSTGGEVVSSPNGFPVLNPWRSVANGASREMHAKLAELGLSPAARARLIVKDRPKDAPNPWEGLLAS